MSSSMLDITSSFYRDVWKQDPFKAIVKCYDSELVLTENPPEKLMSFLELVYAHYSQQPNFENIIGYTKRDKFIRRKRNWVQKAKEGLYNYRNSGKKGRGFYSHLVTNYLKYKEDEASTSAETFFLEYGAKNADEKIKTMEEKLVDWGNDTSRLLCEYPFYGKLSKQQKYDALEIDMIIYMGNWLVSRISNEDDPDLALEEAPETVFLRQAPATAVEEGFFGISRATYKVSEQNIVDDVLVLPKKNKTELEERKKMSIKADSMLLSNEKVSLKTIGQDDETRIRSNGKGGYVKSVRTPDSKDSRLFLDIINRRGADYINRRKIRVDLQDLLETNYKGSISAKTNCKVFNQWEYDDCITRLLRLADFRVTEFTEEGKDGKRNIHYKTLISKMDIYQNVKPGERAYVDIYVSEDVHINILKEEVINVYNEKIQELESDLGYLLVFSLQKKRIQHYDPDSKEEYITFWITLDELGIRLNKKTAKENYDAVLAALEDIKEKDFILKEYQPLGEKIKVKCYQLSKRELEDSTKFKLRLPELVN